MGKDSREAEVRQVSLPPSFENDVRLLHVPMEDALLVGGGEGVGHAEAERERLLQRQRSVLEQAGDTVEIVWTDGHVSRYNHRELRLACPCAMCVDEWTGRPRMNPDHVPAEVRVQEIRPVGRYALQFSFSDGHATGIYAYDKLRAADPSAR